MLGRLELGRVGGQKQQVDVLGDLHLDTTMPAGTVEDEDDFFAGSSAHFTQARRALMRGRDW